MHNAHLVFGNLRRYYSVLICVPLICQDRDYSQSQASELGQPGV